MWHTNMKMFPKAVLLWQISKRNCSHCIVILHGSQPGVCQRSEKWLLLQPAGAWDVLQRGMEQVLNTREWGKRVNTMLNALCVHCFPLLDRILFCSYMLLHCICSVLTYMFSVTYEKFCFLWSEASVCFWITEIQLVSVKSMPSK